MPPEMTYGDGTLATTLPAVPRRRRRDILLPFRGLVLFTVVLLIAPQNYVPALQVLMLAKLTTGIAIIAYLLHRNGRPLTVTTAPVQWALVLAAIAILTIPLGFWPGGSVGVLFDQLAKSLIVFLLIANVVDTPKRVQQLIATMVAGGVVAALIGINQYRSGLLDPDSRITGFESPVATNPNDLALTLNILLALALGLLPTLRRPWPRLLTQGAIALLVAGIVATFSRGGFITLCVLGALWAVRAVRERGVQALAGVALAAVALGVAAPGAYMNRLSTITNTRADTTGSAEERWQTMTEAVGLILERPLFGVGLGNSRHVLVVRGSGDHETHNAYLKVGAELGVGGGAAYILLVVSAWAAARQARRRLARRRDARDLYALASGIELSVVVFAVGALFSPVPYHFYFFYPAGLAVAVSVMAARPALRGA